MPKAWSSKDERKYEHIKESSRERKYEHIKESSRERGMSTDRAEEIAARTVNKGRRQEGRTPNKTTQGTGNPNRGYDARTKDELYNIARERGIEGRSSMSKAELVKALRK